MEEKDLIKKLETLELPEIELKSHKENLKMALLNSDYFKKQDFFEIFRNIFGFCFSNLGFFNPYWHYCH